MAKVKKAWFCTSCGNESPKWMGRCPACGEWNTLQEEIVSKENPLRGPSTSLRNGSRSTKVEPLSSISCSEENRISLGSTELDRILGGGLVTGSLILIGGEPGIGKSTLSLQIPLRCHNLRTLYVSGEESPSQIKLRAQRLGGEGENCLVLSETLIENVIEKSNEIIPELIIIDSIQTMYSQGVENSPGSISQVRECATLLLRYCKETNIPVIVIGHITKDGMIAGPKILEHIVDVVLQFEGDTRHSYRILRSIKNRFGSTAELAIFEMINSGLREVTNPSEMLIPMHEENLSGIAVASMLDGTRPFLIETQALVSTAAYGTPQRSATGFDVRRMNMILAVLEKRAGFHLSAKDVFLNIAGGLKISDPACDLAIACAILSSNFDISISQKICFSGEIGLSGEIRPVSQIEKRIDEAGKLGFETIYISSYNHPSIEKRSASSANKIAIHKVKDIPELVRLVFR
ncbi:MAG TPA: DNA repair protein RadA [Bacteroidales bacterium]|nr:DNA repair protein RadA [Bacteroidales bacterium]HRT33322.1 DNA repair protein RadA [Bacteroidales bacterium]